MLSLPPRNKKIKFSNDPNLPYLQDFFDGISLTKLSIPEVWFLHAALQQNACTSSIIFHNPVTLNEGQDHSNCCQDVEFNHV